MGSVRMKSAEEYDKMIKELQQKKREAAAIEKKRKAALMKRNMGKRNEKLYNAMAKYLKSIGVTDEMLVEESVEKLEQKIVGSFSGKEITGENSNSLGAANMEMQSDIDS